MAESWTSLIDPDRLPHLPGPIVPDWLTPSWLRGLSHQQMLLSAAFPVSVFDQIADSRYPAISAALMRYAAFGPTVRCPVFEGRYSSVPADLNSLMAITESTHVDRIASTLVGWVPCSDGRLYNLDLAAAQIPMIRYALLTRRRSYKALTKRVGGKKGGLTPCGLSNAEAEWLLCDERAHALSETLKQIADVRKALGASWTSVSVPRESGAWVNRRDAGKDAVTAPPVTVDPTRSADLFENLALGGIAAAEGRHGC